MEAAAFTESASVRRERLVLEHVKVVKAIARRVAASAPAGVDLDDFISMGMMGLIGAADTFDETKGVKFSTYASRRVRGAMLDELRKLDVMSRHMRAKAGRLRKAYEEAGKRLGGAPDSDDVARHLGVGVDEVHAMTIECTVRIVNDGALLDGLAHPGQSDPEAIAMLNELKARLAEAIDGLGAREKVVLSLYYKEELTYREMAEALGISESRACQTHAMALKKLKRTIGRKTADRRPHAPARIIELPAARPSRGVREAA